MLDQLGWSRGVRRAGGRRNRVGKAVHLDRPGQGGGGARIRNLGRVLFPTPSLVSPAWAAWIGTSSFACAYLSRPIGMAGALCRKRRKHPLAPRSPPDASSLLRLPLNLSWIQCRLASLYLPVQVRVVLYFIYSKKRGPPLSNDFRHWLYTSELNTFYFHINAKVTLICHCLLCDKVTAFFDKADWIE